MVETEKNLARQRFGTKTKRNIIYINMQTIDIII